MLNRDSTVCIAKLNWKCAFVSGVIPKSVSPDRIFDNMKLDFIISESDITALNGIPTVEKYAWDPAAVV
jgi:diketogulonate reductase-like aldo/keto reductase